MRRIAVWNTAFLGDAVLTLPLLQSLRLRYPDARLDFYVRSGLQGLFTPQPALSAVYGFDKRGGHKGAAGLLNTARTVRSGRYDLWISTHLSPRSGMIALASGASVRIGYKQAFLAPLVYTQTVARRFDELDEIERLLELLRPLGDGPVSTWPELALGLNESESAERFFASVQGPALGLHPGSVWATKRWPARHFAEIGVKALQTGAHVLLFAGPGEEGIAQAVHAYIADGIPEQGLSRLHNLAGQLSLPLLAAYLKHLSCYVTNDSGPMHLAWAQGTPVTALFGPTVRSLGFFPRGPGATVFETPLSCRPCGLHGPSACPLGHHHCMTQISPERVWPDVEAKLHSKRG